MAQSIFARISQLARANVNALIDAAEDPEVMIDQMIRDYTDNIHEAESSIAQTLGNLRMLESDLADTKNQLEEWGRKAKLASDKAESLRGDEAQSAEADRFDNLARVAIEKQIDIEKSVASLEPTVAAQNEVVEKLREGLNGMKDKLEELKSKRDELVARGRVAEAQNQVHDAIKTIDFADPTSELSRFEEKIRREEARAMGQAELAASTLDSQFEALEDDTAALEVDERLRKLKQGS